ncbi:MAG: uracil-DNA glycosylase [Bacilli bacterium]
MIKIGNDWDEILEKEFSKEYYLNLRQFLKEEYKTQTIYPNMYDIYNAFKYSSFKKTKVVILGQDPYINENQAHGLSFSVKKGVKTPPSLKNIYKEIKTDIGIDMDDHGELTNWANQGILLLNTTLTVRAKKSFSHKGKGWEKFTDNIIQKLNEKKEPVVFLLWGNHAKSKEKLITNPNHLILKAAHPSPLAGGAFFGCKHFSQTNKFLKSNNILPIDWHN